MRHQKEQKATLRTRFMNAVLKAARMLQEKGAGYFDGKQKKKNAMLDRMRKFRIKEIGLEIKKIVYDLEKNVIVDSMNLH
jgi:transposase